MMSATGIASTPRLAQLSQSLCQGVEHMLAPGSMLRAAGALEALAPCGITYKTVLYGTRQPHRVWYMQ